MLSDYLRYERGLTGTKVVCAEGDCGACTVLRYFPLLGGEDGSNFLSVNSCILPLALLHGSHLLTVESLETEKELHQAQSSLRNSHASQCGFCTPGFAMALAGLCEEKLACKQTQINEEEGKNALTGNLCRCTGYNSIVDAAVSIDLKKEKSLKERYHSKEIEGHLRDLCSEEIRFENSNFLFYAPKTYDQAFDFLANNPDTRIIANGTDLGVVHNKRKIKLNKLLSLHLIDEAYKISESKGVVSLGSRVTLTEFRHFLKGKCDEYANYLDIFASPQIKNNATVVGNIANASPIGDNAPVLLSLDGEVELVSSKGSRREKLSEFFLDYRKTSLRNGELIKAIRFELPKPGHFKAFKQSIRKDLDISTLNLAVNIDLEKKQIKQVFIGAGGIAAIPLRLKKTEDFLRDKNLEEMTIAKACEVAQSEFTPIDDVRASASYRRVVFQNSLKRILEQWV